MIGLIIGLLFFIAGIFLLMYEWEFLGVIFCVLSFVFLLFHVPTWLLSERKYQRHIVERNSFIESLENARLNNNKFELAAISKDIFEYNKNLAILKYENGTLLDCYVDDRFLELKPIK